MGYQTKELRGRPVIVGDVEATPVVAHSWLTIRIPGLGSFGADYGRVRRIEIGTGVASYQVAIRDLEAILRLGALLVVVLAVFIRRSK